jgi:hypothetical protein
VSSWLMRHFSAIVGVTASVVSDVGHDGSFCSTIAFELVGTALRAGASRSPHRRTAPSFAGRDLSGSRKKRILCSSALCRLRMRAHRRCGSRLKPNPSLAMKGHSVEHPPMVDCGHRSSDLRRSPHRSSANAL